jgi:hypothetical protein
MCQPPVQLWTVENRKSHLATLHVSACTCSHIPCKACNGSPSLFSIECTPTYRMVWCQCPPAHQSRVCIYQPGQFKIGPGAGQSQLQCAAAEWNGSSSLQSALHVHSAEACCAHHLQNSSFCLGIESSNPHCKAKRHLNYPGVPMALPSMHAHSQCHSALPIISCTGSAWDSPLFL